MRVGGFVEKTVVKIYGDGEFWIDGQKKAKLYPDGEIWADGELIARVYEDGEIYSNGKRIGKVYSDGDLWLDGKKVASGVYLLDLLGSYQKSSSNESSYEYKKQNYSCNGGGNNGSSSRLGSVGGGFIFVTVLLIVAFIYAAFRFWTSELPTILFGNMQTLGSVAMVFVYAGMVITMYLHICMATKNKKTYFRRGLLMQAGVFFANIIVFTILDLIATALSYGYTIGDALGEVGNALAGNFFGFILIGIFVGLAPTIVSSLISSLCIKKGIIASLPYGVKSIFAGFEKKKVSFNSSTFSMPKVSFEGTKKYSYSKKTKFSDWDGERIAKALCCTIFLLMLNFYGASIAAIASGLEMEAMETGMYMVSTVALIAGIIIRRKYQENCRRPFLFGWAVQSVLLFVVSVINLNSLFGAYAATVIGEECLSLCAMSFFFGALITLFSNVFVRE